VQGLCCSANLSLKNYFVIMSVHYYFNDDGDRMEDYGEDGPPVLLDCSDSDESDSDEDDVPLARPTQGRRAPAFLHTAAVHSYFNNAADCMVAISTGVMGADEDEPPELVAWSDDEDDATLLQLRRLAPLLLSAVEDDFVEDPSDAEEKLPLREDPLPAAADVPPMPAAPMPHSYGTDELLPEPLQRRTCVHRASNSTRIRKIEIMKRSKCCCNSCSAAVCLRSLFASGKWLKHLHKKLQKPIREANTDARRGD
jgi:hypothetical protein